MIADSNVRRVDCRFFLSPMLADALFVFNYFDLWPELEKLKRELADLAPTYDFTRYSHLIEERTGDRSSIGRKRSTSRRRSES
jgi:hypothetical protein